MGSLNGRVQRLEERNREPTRPTRTQQEVWAIDAEIRNIEAEMRAEGMDPDEYLRGVSVEMPLDEHIAMLEAEIAALEEEIGRCQD